MAIVRRPRAEIDLTKMDWAGLAQVTDAEIEAQIAADSDTASLFTEAELARALSLRSGLAQDK